MGVCHSNEGYLRSANRGSNNLRQPIYESIAAIFWQSASYVLNLTHF